MIVKNITWWICATVAGIFMQWAIPGVDFLLPAYLVALCERSHVVQLILVFCLFIIINEGLGTLNFGGMLLWYLAISVLFFIGNKLIHNHFAIFSTILALLSGCLHYIIIQCMCDLQNLEFDQEILLYDCCKQVLILPFAWKFLLWTRPAGFENGFKN